MEEQFESPEEGKNMLLCSSVFYGIFFIARAVVATPIEIERDLAFLFAYSFSGDIISRPIISPGKRRIERTGGILNVSR